MPSISRFYSWGILWGWFDMRMSRMTKICWRTAISHRKLWNFTILNKGNRHIEMTNYSSNCLIAGETNKSCVINSSRFFTPTSKLSHFSQIERMYPACLNITDALDINLCINTSTIDEDEMSPLFDENMEKIVSTTVVILFGFIFVAGLIGNALVVIGNILSSVKISDFISFILSSYTVVAFNPLMRSTTNILIINLAISDLMFVIMCIPFTGE